ncbi:glycoside hydrolase family 3 protein [Actinopolymorpha pittospori]|uniref:beta-N-acetylhexosaminidase n=1 Tax=Actinopolymorpha pittospori TaxID=648752 RepID=A0A927RML7_9ACTN|nr:glycoside hydrolase family 3 protein [Actinopolymorpha pittospori]MBE1609063.1 beta-N-acetylhexosaminidase [Actinopolymorpha pittospori]
MSVGRTVARTKLRLAVAVLGVVGAAAGCGNGSAAPAQPPQPPVSATSRAPSPPATPSPVPSPPVSSSATPTAPARPTPRSTTQAQECVDQVYSGMSSAQRVGQLIMSAVDTSGVTASDLDLLRRDHVGGVILMGHTNAGAQHVRSLTDRVQSVAPTVAGSRVGLLVSVDQEGGQVQVLNGPGFSEMPAADVQGNWPTAQLQQRAADWGRQLRGAGVNLNLAPVVDVVPPDLVSANHPIGRLSRGYGNDPETVARQSTAFLRGLAQSHVESTLKHFPSLGHVVGNTDFSADVTDDVTTRTGDFVLPYRSGIQAGAGFVMASLATYTRIDPANLSVFSSVLLRDVLRDQLGFEGVVMSDDMGNTVALKSVPPGERATRFLAAGGDMVLTVDPSTVDAMTSAVLSRVSSDASFRAHVDASVHRVLAAKVKAGLLDCSG